LEEVFDSPSLFEEDRWHRERARKQAGTLNVGESRVIISKNIQGAFFSCLSLHTNRDGIPCFVGHLYLFLAIMILSRMVSSGKPLIEEFTAKKRQSTGYKQFREL